MYQAKATDSLIRVHAIVLAIQVLYMQPVSDLGTLQLHDLAAAVRNVMQAAGISMTQSNRSFSPHCTVAKINNVAGQACSIRQIPQAHLWTQTRLSPRMFYREECRAHA
jgi:hypothetical protein